jgi:DNA-binding NarL/FixJ family response regulator
METVPKINKNARGRVYVVDDEFLPKETLENLIGDAGWNVVGSSCDSEEAIAAIPSLDVDVAVLDIRFREGPNGIEIARAIRRCCDTEVIFVTAHSDEETKETAESVNPAGYLDKPISSLDELGPLLERAVAHRGFVRANKERLHLISLRGRQGFSAEQTRRLETLEQITTAYLDRFHSPDTAVVDSLLQRARKIVR